LEFINEHEKTQDIWGYWEYRKMPNLKSLGFKKLIENFDDNGFRRCND